METIIVFIDDADYAVQMLQPMLPATNHNPTRWVLVGCAPRITRRVGKWVTKGAGPNWQLAWAAKGFAQVLPSLQQPGRTHDEIITQLVPSRQSLCDLTQSLTQQYGSSRVLDARRPKLGHELQPVTPGQKQERQMTGYAAALAGAGVLAGFD